MAEESKPLDPIPVPVVDPNQLELFKELISVQKEELGLRRQEHELSIQAQKDGHDYAKISLDAQVKDREGGRRHRQKVFVYTLCFIGFIVLVLLIFSAFAISAGKEAFVLEIAKLILAFVMGAMGGGGAGFVYGRRKSSEVETDNG
jgi:hypothetical protein